MHEGYGEKFPVPVLFEKLLLAGRGGLKSGKGIYVNGVVDDEFFEIVQEIQSETGIKGTEFSPEKLILRQVNGAVCCLQEQIAFAEEIDRAMALGTGFLLVKRGSAGLSIGLTKRDWVVSLTV